MGGRGIWIGRGRGGAAGGDARLRMTRRRRTWPRSRPSACRGPRAAPRAAPGPRRGRAASRRSRPRGRGVTTGPAIHPSPNFQKPRGRRPTPPQNHGARAAARAGSSATRRTTPATASRSAARAAVETGASPWPCVASRPATGSRPNQYRRDSPARSMKTTPRPWSPRRVRTTRKRRSATVWATASCRRHCSRRPMTVVYERPSSSSGGASAVGAAPLAPS